MSWRLIPSWGQSGNQPPATRNVILPRDSILLPASPSLERGQISQALFDVGTLLVWLFIGILAALVVGGPFLVLGWMIFFN